MRWMFVLALLALPVFGAGEAAAADTYGAIAFSQGNGARGFGYNYGSRADAEERALQECGRGCSVVLWFRNSCGALAVGRGNGYGVYHAVEEDDVEEGALAECGKRTSGCELKRLVCSSQ